MSAHTKRKIGFVSTRFAGTDGVSLETEKWSTVLTNLGHECFYFAGELDRPAERSMLVEMAHFEHQYIQEVGHDLFDDFIRSSDTSGRLHSLRYYLKPHLYEFVSQFELDLLIIENALSIPMNVPLGLALSEFIAETGLPTIAHHHDFAWERERFSVNAAMDLLRAAFPPILPSLRHVVINSVAGQQLALRTGASSTLIPNVMDFSNPPTPADGYTTDLREELGLKPKEKMLLQPTRIVPRKRIEKAIELARRLELPIALVITHHAGDEGLEYQDYLLEYAEMMGVRMILAGDRFSYNRATSEDGKKIYSLQDAYQTADLITYPSTVEGFGNAFLETLYFRRPIVMSTYSIYRVDIQPKGFQVVAFGDVLDRETVAQARDLLTDPDLVASVVERNYLLAKRHYSYEVLENQLVALINECLGV